MPLYDILNEFQKVSSHMAAVVKAKRKVQNPISLCGEEKIEETKMVGGSVSTLTTPLLQEEKSESCIVDIKKGTKQHIDGDKQTSLLQNDSANKHVADVVEEIDDGEVIGIITLEDVFEELLQEEIVDENDEYVDVHKRIRVAAAAAASSVARAPSVRRFNWSKDTATIHLLFHSCWGGSESTSHNFKFCENPTKHSRVFD